MNRQESAENLARDAFVWVAGQEELMERFLNASGHPAGGFGAAVTDPVFLGAVLDFILAEDATVMAFCDAQGLAYLAPMEARRALPGGEQVHWT